MKTKLELAEVLYPRKTRYFSVTAQIFVVAAFFVLYTLLSYLDIQKTGKMWGYPLSVSILFVPIYEELIFRGFILSGLTRFYSTRSSIVIASLLFGIWHIKNIFFISTSDLISQILYATLIFGPLAALVILRTKNIWAVVMLHYANNMIAPFLKFALLLLLGRFF